MTMLTASFDRAEEGAYDRMTQAWQWLCEQRTQAPDHADVWDIRWQNLNTGERWLTDLTERVLRGEYRLTPLQLQGTGEQRKAVWGAQDALVLKWAALSLQHQLPLHESCEHVKGHGSGKQSIEKLHSLLTAQSVDSEKKTAAGTTPDAAEIRHYKWVCRTDIRGYYRNINKQTLIQQVRQHVTAPVLRDLVQQYIHYTVEDGGTFHTPEKGISRGCPLSPLMGALHLFDMDEHFSNQPNIHYARYMDDIIILAKTRWSLRKHTKRLIQWFGEYGFEAHPDKTQIGRTAKGFDWMGARLTHEGVTDVAPRAKANHREKVRRLYEQLARLPKWKRKSAAPKVHARVSTYRKRWNIWAERINRDARRLPISEAERRGARRSHGGGERSTRLTRVGSRPLTNTRPALGWVLLTGCTILILVNVSSQQAYAGVLTSSSCWLQATPNTPPGTSICSAYVADGSYTGSPNVNGLGGGTAVQLSSAGGSSIVAGAPVRPGYTSVVIATPTAKGCGLGLTLGPSQANAVWDETYSARKLPASGALTNASNQLYNCKVGGNTVCGLSTYAKLDVIYLGSGTGAAGTCPTGTVIGKACAQDLGFTQKTSATTTGIWASSSALLSSCPSGTTLVQVTTGGEFTPPETPTCALSVDPPSGSHPIDDVQPAAVAGMGKGGVLSVGTNIKITSTCTTSKGGVNVRTDGVYTSKSGDFTKAGFDATTNTYVGLLDGSNPKAAPGNIVTDADLWTSTTASMSPQITNLIPVVIRGSNAPNVGSGTVTMTVTAVAP